MQIRVKRHVRQIKDGSHYDGHIEIAGVKFDYEIVFGIPIPDLPSPDTLNDADSVRRIFQLTLKKNGENIELTDEEYFYFFQIIVKFVLSFYRDPGTRKSQNGSIGLILRGESLLAAFGAFAELKQEDLIIYDTPEPFCAILASSKFGCALTA